MEHIRLWIDQMGLKPNVALGLLAVFFIIYVLAQLTNRKPKA